jgi:prepilin-type N-terminal cleavage/methylation domain-containing protein
MKKLILKARGYCRSKKGFSLVEGMVAVTLVGILAVVGTLVMNNVVGNARAKSGHEIASELTTLARGYIDNGGVMANLDLTSFATAYEDISGGLTADGVTFQYVPPSGKTPVAAEFSVSANGIFTYTGSGSISPWQ